jgi:hypothetical protein
MAIDEHIECPGCRRAVIPRLWFTGGDYMSYIKTQHVCPFCGVVMYETGGGYKRGAVFATVLAVIIALLTLIVFLNYMIRT